MIVKSIFTATTAGILSWQAGLFEPGGFLGPNKCELDGGAAVYMNDGEKPIGTINGYDLHLSKDGSWVSQGVNNPQPLCKVVTSQEGFAEAAAQDAPVVDLERVAIRHPDGSLDILIKSTGAYDETIGELHDHGTTATYLITDQSGAETMFSAEVEPGTNWKPLSELKPAKTPGRELKANEI